MCIIFTEFLIVFEVISKVQTICICFFFQAEDGIRDLVRSRGLGDVYKRQAQVIAAGHRVLADGFHFRPQAFPELAQVIDRPDSVSYTHLTLPTSDLV